MIGLRNSTRIAMLVLGWLALGVGVLGVFLPLLPTTPFVLLAAFFFSRGSKRCHDWLLANRTFGPLIQDWERGGVIRLTAKIWATAMIVPLFSYTLLFVHVETWVKGTVALVGVAALTFIWTRPSGLERSQDKAA